MVAGGLTRRTVDSTSAVKNTWRARLGSAVWLTGGLLSWTTTLLPVYMVTMPYSAVVSTAFAPLVVGVLFIAAAARRARRRGRY